MLAPVHANSEDWIAGRQHSKQMLHSFGLVFQRRAEYGFGEYGVKHRAQ